MTRAPKPMSVFGAMEGMHADYRIAQANKYRRDKVGIPAMGSPGDYHLRNEASWMRAIEYCRDLDRNDPLIGPGIARLVDNVLGPGMTLDPKTGDSVLDDDIYAMWTDWSEDPDQCDLSGRLPLNEIARLDLHSTVVDGDCLELLTREEAVETIEAHRLRTPTGTTRNCVFGVLMDDHRKPLEYWITKEDMGLFGAVKYVNQIVPMAARDKNGLKLVTHSYVPKRVSLTRGISWLAPIADTAAMRGDIEFAALVKQQVSACFAIFRERTEFWRKGKNEIKGAQSAEYLSDGGTRLNEQVSPGMEIQGDPGEKLTGFSPTIPNPGFTEHMYLTSQIIAINLCLPMHVLMMDPTKTNFSGWRGAVNEAQKMWREHRRLITYQFYDPIYKWKLAQWISKDAAIRSAFKRLGKKLFLHQFNAPVTPYIQPEIEAKADRERLDGNLASPRQIQGERGREYQTVIDETIEDRGYAIRKAMEAAIEINSDPKLKEAGRVDWHELLASPTAPTFDKTGDAVNDAPAEPPTNIAPDAQPGD